MFMSFPRLAVLVLPVVFALALLTGGCGTPVGLAAVSYGADRVSLAGSGKTSGDHFTSMVTKKDCAFSRMFRKQNICREREGDHDPYHVNCNEPFPDPSEGCGVRYAWPLPSAA